MKAKRLSKLQRTLLIILSKKRGRYFYSDLREKTMHCLKVYWQKDDSFKVSFSRSLKNLVEKRLVKRKPCDWYLWRSDWEEIRLTKRGMAIVASLSNPNG